MGTAPWPPEGLSAREREILDIVYRRGTASASDIGSELAAPPVAAAVRTMLRRLEAKGHIRHRVDGRRHLYEPTVERGRARLLAFEWFARTFFSGSYVQAAAAALDQAATEVPEAELAELEALVERMADLESGAETGPDEGGAP